MSSAAGSNIVTSGLILALDAANRKSYIGAAPASLINTNSWTVSSGSVDGYSQNGNTGENTRLYDTDPWGNQSIVWGTYASGDGGADGGWNTNYPSIDATKLYRFSVWVRRTSSTGAGTFYFGTGAGGGEVRRTDNGATQGNPYWECTGTSALTQNQWYLVCGHIYPHFSTYTGRHPNTGYFTIAGGTTKVMDVNGCNIGQDLKWDSTSTSAVHRTYHYYCGDATTRLQFMGPRIDLCNGNEPSISELLTNGNSVWKNVSGNGNNGFLANGPTYSSANGGSIVSDGVDDYVNVGSLGSQFTNFTVEIWFKSDSVTNYRNPIDCNWLIENGSYSNIGPRLEQNSAGNLTWIVGSGSDVYSFLALVPSGLSSIPYHHAVITKTSSTNFNGYYNGNYTSSLSFSGWAGSMLNVNVARGFSLSGERWFIGKIPLVRIYNRALSQTEVAQNFNASRRKFGI